MHDAAGVHCRPGRRDWIVAWTGVAAIWVVGLPVTYYLGVPGLTLLVVVIVALQLLYFRDPLRRNWRPIVRFLAFAIFRTVVLGGLFVGLLVTDPGWPIVVLMSAGAWAALATVELTFRYEPEVWRAPRAKRIEVVGESFVVTAVAMFAIAEGAWWFVAVLLLIPVVVCWKAAGVISQRASSSPQD